MELSKKVASAEASVTLAIAAKAAELQKKGIDVISLSAGEPDFDTPAFIKQAAIDALNKGITKYTPATGTLAIREAVCRKFKRDQNLTYPPDQIIVSGGAKHSIFNVFFALLNEGDEVLIPAPFWLSYPSMVEYCGGVSIIVPTDESTEFKITPEHLRKCLTPKTKVFVLNSPSNPTGAVYTRAELEALVKVLKEFPRVVILSDEIYEALLFDGRKHESIAALDPEMTARTVIVNGHSKAYAMTGWRLGYAACPNKELAKAIAAFQSHSTSNPTAFAQAGGVVALDQGWEEAKKMCAVYEKRRGMFYDLIAAVPQLVPFKPQGAFYLFVNVKKSGLSSSALTQKLLEEAHVAVVPGEPFGSDAHIRMSFATSEAKLQEAAKRIAAWFKK
ncbi:MAG TPA: pyridoxal phosphate-dependent aminotransferase [Verrucomicrobiae bacterium]|jgi:aspartate aminotransferase|nr:pyridoxal phosphate-dependent aminotransferase [Verrucomicrobiae bacterium]